MATLKEHQAAMVDYKYLDPHTCYMYSQMYGEAVVCDGDLMKVVIEDEE